MIGADQVHKRIQIWDPMTGHSPATLLQNDAPLCVAAMSPNEQRFAGGQPDGTLRLWDATGRELWSVAAHSDRIDGLAFSPNGELLGSAGWDGTLKLWDVAHGTLQRQWGPFDQGLHGVSFSPDGQKIVCGFHAYSKDTNQFSVWSTRTGNPVLTLQADDMAIKYARFSPDGRWLVTTGPTNSIVFWDAQTGRRTKTLSPISSQITALAFSSDGTLLAAGGAKEVGVWRWQRKSGFSPSQPPGNAGNWALVPKTNGSRHFMLTASVKPTSGICRRENPRRFPPTSKPHGPSPTAPMAVCSPQAAVIAASKFGMRRLTSCSTPFLRRTGDPWPSARMDSSFSAVATKGRANFGHEQWQSDPLF